MGHEIELKLAMRESDFITELLSKCNYGEGSDVRQTFEEKLETERQRIIELIMGANE